MPDSTPYRVFARKYRPRSFAEVIGQDHIVRALSGAIERGRVAQAYLLAGPRGVGKTTTARIIAKSLNCETGPTLEPCLTCDACCEIEKGNDIDVIEIDGASNNGVEDVRSIRDAIHARPMRDPRKIYIIDEVQRLTASAFDALLKTLEEPPAHAMFLFATTDPHKIPDTIVSRCQVFEFRRLREVDIAKKLELIAQNEGVQVPEDVLHAIARGCRGGMRDAESMLDQALAVTGETLTLEDLELIAGLARPERWLSLFEAMVRDDAPAILHEVEDYLTHGGTERDFVEQSIDALRDLLHVALLGEDSLGIEPSPKRRDRMRELAKAMGRDRLEAVLGMMFSLEGRMNAAPLAARALLEWTLLRAARFNDWLDLATLTASLGKGEGQQKITTEKAKPKLAKPKPVEAQPEPVEPKPKPVEAKPEPVEPKPEPDLPRSIPDMLVWAEEVRPTLGRLLRENFLQGEIRPNGVHLNLRMPTDRDRSVLDDPLEQSTLSQLPGSPGVWSWDYHQPQVGPEDDNIKNILESFDGREETP